MMIQWLFQKRELLTTFDGRFYDSICNGLSGLGIPYKTKWHSDIYGGRTRGTMGSFGERNRTQYYIYVLKKDLEKAMTVLK